MADRGKTFKKITKTVLGVETEFSIKVYKNGIFEIIWPDIVCERSEREDDDTSPILVDLEKTIDATVKEINTQATVIEHILVYRFDGEVHEHASCDASRASLNIRWNAYRKTTIGKEIVYKHIGWTPFDDWKEAKYNPPPLDIPHYMVFGNTFDVNSHYYGNDSALSPEAVNVTVLPLTVENLAFFVRIAKQIEQLNKHIADFLNPETIAQVIAANTPLQLNGKPAATAESGGGK